MFDMLSFLEGIGLQDAIFILAAAVLGPYFTLYWLEHRPKIVAKMLRAIKKDPEVRREIIEIFMLGEDDEPDEYLVAEELVRRPPT